MSRKQKLIIITVLGVGLLVFLALRLHHLKAAVLSPRGTVGQQERHLIIVAGLLSLIVVIPVYVMLFSFAWKYRETNSQARYEPAFDHSRQLESIWWGVPLAMIIILGVITWRSSHALDPFKPLNSATPPLTIQVVALQWKWLFIYPGQNVATLNYVQFPINTPVKFEITSDAPMNSFWIPQLGGQIYAMSGMATELNLDASKLGTYQGTSANISGQGFAGMHFTVNASTPASFQQWIQIIKKNLQPLDAAAYDNLAKPSQNDPVKDFSTASSGLFDSVIAKYQAPVYFNPAEAK